MADNSFKICRRIIAGCVNDMLNQCNIKGLFGDSLESVY